MIQPVEQLRNEIAAIDRELAETAETQATAQTIMNSAAAVSDACRACRW